MSRRAPRPFSLALDALRERLEPAGALAAVQRSWATVAGPAIAGSARPVAVREGVLIIECESAVWAQELQLMGPDLLPGLSEAAGAELVSLRCKVAASDA